MNFIVSGNGLRNLILSEFRIDRIGLGADFGEACEDVRHLTSQLLIFAQELGGFLRVCLSASFRTLPQCFVSGDLGGGCFGGDDLGKLSGIFPYRAVTAAWARSQRL